MIIFYKFRPKVEKPLSACLQGKDHTAISGLRFHENRLNTFMFLDELLLQRPRESTQENVRAYDSVNRMAGWVEQPQKLKSAL